MPGVLESERRRTFVYLTYADDSSDHQAGTAMVGSVLIEDRVFTNVENVAGMVIEDLIPPEKLAAFEEFHAADLYGGHGAFEGIDSPQRFHAIETLLKSVRSFELTFVYSCVDARALSSSALGGGNPIDTAFRMCVLGVENYISSQHVLHAPVPLSLLIMDETKDSQLKSQLKRSFNTLRRKMIAPFQGQRLWHFHDDMYFGDSKYSVGIQIADLCGYFVMREMKEKGDHDLFGIISQRVVCAKPEPEWTQNRGYFMELGVQKAI